MEFFLQAGFRSDELATLNQCRMFLHVILLSDICNGVGTVIKNQCWSGTHPANHYNYHWPQTQKPMRRDWELWQRGLSQGLNLGRQGKLAIPLGKWVNRMYTMNGWFTDPLGEQLYHLHNDHWTTYAPIPLCRRMWSFNSQGHSIEHKDVPRPLNRVTVYAHGLVIMITGHGPINPQVTVIENKLDQQFWEMWKYEETLEGRAEELGEDIWQGLAVAVSDSSFQLGNGAAAWTIEGATATNRIKGAICTPSSGNDQSAYCSELIGLWGILYSLKRFTEVNHITQGQVLIACDGISALQKTQTDAMAKPQDKHYDVIGAIHNLRRQLPLQLKFRHMKGYQDSEQITVLSREAWMNIAMDEDAKKKVSTDKIPDQQYNLLHEGWICYLEGVRIIKNLMTALRVHLNGPILLNHWVTTQ